MIDRERREIQHAEVRITVALPVDHAATTAERKAAIHRKLRLSEYVDGLELRPGLTSRKTRLLRTETPTEAADRRLGEAEARHEAELDRRRERYFDEHGHF